MTQRDETDLRYAARELEVARNSDPDNELYRLQILADQPNDRTMRVMHWLTITPEQFEQIVKLLTDPRAVVLDGTDIDGSV